MTLQVQTAAAVLLRSDGPMFDQVVRDEDVFGAVFTGITPWDLGLTESRLERPRMRRGEPECVRGVGTALRRERPPTS